MAIRGAASLVYPCLVALLALGLKGARSEGAAGNDTVVMDAIMPPFTTDHEDTYLCTSVALPDQPLKLVGIQALASMEIVHHILLFGCASPAKTDSVWSCHMSAACGQGQDAVLFGWGKNAPALQLPDGTGFSVGPGTSIRTVVLQVHYLPIRPADDASGVRLTLTTQPVPYSAGMLSFASVFAIPPGQDSHLVPNECCYSGFEPLTAFGFRVHTHWLGRSVYMEQQREAAGSFLEAARQDPQLPQGFYPVEPRNVIRPGDRVRVTCNFNSSAEAAEVRAGHTSKDEMCNMYIMLYSQLPFFQYCVDSKPWNTPEGPGSLSSKAALVAEMAVWQPPTEVEGTPVGQVAGVAVGTNSTLWVLHRGGRVWGPNSFGADNRITEAEPIQGPMVLQLDQDTGAVLRSWGSGELFMPHMITPDPDGSVWVTDVGLHQAIKYSPDGTRLMELGKRLQPGSSNDTLCKPTHVAVGRDGTIYVADGYCNSRVVVYDAEGRYRTQFELPKSSGRGPMLVPHSLALHECRQQIFVADREGAAVHAFKLDNGKLAGTWNLKRWGLPYALTMGPYGQVLALLWDRSGAGRSVRVVGLKPMPGSIQGPWEVPGAASPHDLALVPAPLAVTGVRERALAVLVAETRAPGEGPSRLHKLVFTAPDSGAGAATPTSPKPAAGKQEQEQPAGLAASHIKGVELEAADGAAPAPSPAPPAGGDSAAPGPQGAAEQQAGDQQHKQEGQQGQQQQEQQQEEEQQREAEASRSDPEAAPAPAEATAAAGGEQQEGQGQQQGEQEQEQEGGSADAGDRLAGGEGEEGEGSQAPASGEAPSAAAVEPAGAPASSGAAELQAALAASAASQAGGTAAAAAAAKPIVLTAALGVVAAATAALLLSRVSAWRRAHAGYHLPPHHAHSHARRDASHAA